MTCKHCGGSVQSGLRGRRRLYCDDACRHKAHRRRRRRAGALVPLRSGQAEAPDLGRPLDVVASPADWRAFVAWVRDAYETTGATEQILRLIEQTATRYEAARAALDAHGLTQAAANGRVVLRPEVTVEKDCRTALLLLVKALELEDTSAQAETTPQRFPRLA